MIEFKEYHLDNGLHVVLHKDASTPLVAVNMLYKVGSKNEHPERTGFAHLFEHLMFSGSENVQDFDIPVQMAGGENNAYTNSDITNFYNIAPAVNMDTLLWLESDRMKNLSINSRSLAVQQKVVVEEFKEVCLNQPYGTIWHHLNGLAYQKHPYQWPTIGKDFHHISEATLEEVKSFYQKYYHPGNAILTICGDIEYSETIDKVHQWFSDIPARKEVKKSWIQEPNQQKFREKIVREEVPTQALFMAFHMEERNSEGYYHSDLLSDVLSNGRSSRFYKKLYKNLDIFTNIDAYISGSIEPGLFLIESKLKDDQSLDEARKVIWDQLEELKVNPISEEELKKIQNKVESAYVFGEVSILNKAINLAYFAHLNQTEAINHQVEHYRKITPESLQNHAKKLFRKENCSELVYLPEDEKEIVI